MPHTVRLHHVIAAPPEKIYRAFLDPDAMARWLPPDGFTGRVETVDARVGGSYRMAFTNFTTGTSFGFHGRFRELVPHTRLVYTDVFDDPNLPGEVLVTVDLARLVEPEIPD